MMRRRLVASLVTACVGVISGVGALASSGGASAATTTNMFVTYYGWYDNSPPGNDIAYPDLHSGAGGTGTYADPLTFASDTAELKAGTRIYNPTVQKYFIMEDDCVECDEDWSGKGPDGGPKLWHVDLWLGGKGGNERAAIDCEDALTQNNLDGTPILSSVIVNPPSTEKVSSEALFNTSTGRCYGGATAASTLGQYKNSSNGLCLNDPNNSSTSGTAAGFATCNGSAGEQVTFDGAFFTVHNLCLTSASKYTFSSCSGGPSQQWSWNPNGTITGIQSAKCIQASGSGLVTATCNGSSAQKWSFTASGSVPTPSPTPSPSKTPSPSPSPTAGAKTYEAEKATLAGGARSGSCSACSGGAKAGYVGQGGTVTFTGVSASAAGSRTLTVAYLSGAARNLTVTVNGKAYNLTGLNSGSFQTVATKTVTIALNAGSNTIVLGNSAAYAPDIDNIKI